MLHQHRSDPLLEEFKAGGGVSRRALCLNQASEEDRQSDECERFHPGEASSV
jgi:hypothetical protein